MHLKWLVRDMARTLLATPGDFFIEVWRKGDDWGWARRPGGQALPPGAHVVAQEHIQTNDQEPATDDESISAYATELLAWLERHV